MDGLSIREAQAGDLPALVAIFAADEVGGHGDTTDASQRPHYERAFATIAASASDTLYVAELDGEVVGTFQTTLVTALTGRGGASLIVEAVQTRGDMRGRGIGARMIAHAIERGREVGARQAQLTSNLSRTDAHRFYERLGFAKSHAGFKLKLR